MKLLLTRSNFVFKRLILKYAPTIFVNEFHVIIHNIILLN